MIWNEYIAVKKAEWVGKAVIWNGKKYRVVDVDSNAALMIDLPSRFNPTTAVSETDVTLVPGKSPELIKLIRGMYRPGMRIEVDCLVSPLSPGDRGTVSHVDDFGDIHVDWDNGHSLALVSGLNHFHLLGPYVEGGS